MLNLTLRLNVALCAEQNKRRDYKLKELIWQGKEDYEQRNKLVLS